MKRFKTTLLITALLSIFSISMTGQTTNPIVGNENISIGYGSNGPMSNGPTGSFPFEKVWYVDINAAQAVHFSYTTDMVYGSHQLYFYEQETDGTYQPVDIITTYISNDQPLNFATGYSRGTCSTRVKNGKAKVVLIGYVSGTAKFNVQFAADNSLSTNNDLIVDGNALVKGALVANGPITSNGTLTSNQSINSNGLLTSSGAFVSTGAFTVNGTPQINGNITVTGTGTFGTNTVISGTGNSYFNGGNVGIGTTTTNAKLNVFMPTTKAGNDVIAYFQKEANQYGGSAIVRIGHQTTADLEVNAGTTGTFRYGTSYDFNIVNNYLGGGTGAGGINLVTNGAVKMTINYLGNVGIGTTSLYPGAKLTVGGTTYLNGETRVYGDTYLSGNTYFGSGGILSKNTLNYPTIGTNGAIPLIFNINGNEKLRIDNNGNVGIGTGTTAPSAKLDVNGDININSGVDNNHIYWGGHNMTMGTKPGDYAHNVFTLKPGGASEGKLISIFCMWNANSTTDFEQKVQIVTDGITYFNGGYVGIGTTKPDALLTVNGTIHAKEVNVTVDIPADYVFKPTYKLMPLHEVEQFVKTNSHLPEIPSAAEVSKNGVNVGEMQNKLLQKVEELTLYVIEQNKKIETQSAKIEQLERKGNR